MGAGGGIEPLSETYEAPCSTSRVHLPNKKCSKEHSLLGKYLVTRRSKAMLSRWRLINY